MGNWAQAANPRCWGMPFKLTLMACAIPVILAGEGVLAVSFYAPLLLCVGGLLVVAELQARGPAGGLRCLLAVELMAAALCLPVSAFWWPASAAAGALGVGIAALLLYPRGGRA